MIFIAILALIIGGLLLIAGAVVGRAAMTMIAVARGSRRWPTVPGRIVRSEIRDGRAVIRYMYPVQGADYQGTDVAAGDWPYRSARTAAHRLRRYPVGAEVTVYYDPRYPTTIAMLNPGLSSGIFYLPVVAMLLLLVAFALLRWSVWRLFY